MTVTSEYARALTRFVEAAEELAGKHDDPRVRGVAAGCLALLGGLDDIVADSRDLTADLIAERAQMEAVEAFEKDCGTGRPDEGESRRRPQ